MPIALKPGNGGYGLEPYRTEDGQFAKVSFSVDGQDGQKHEISNIEDYVEARLTPPQKAIYDTWDESRKDTVRQRLFSEFESQMQNRVDEMNSIEASGIKTVKHRHTAEEVVNEIGEIMTKEVVSAYLSKPAIKNRIASGVQDGVFLARDGSIKPSSALSGVSYMASVLQEQLYGTSFFKEGDKAEYDSAASITDMFKSKTRRKITRQEYRDGLIKTITSGNRFLRIHRNPGSSDVLSKQEIADSFFGETQGIKTLLGNQSGCHQTVIYCAMDRRYSEDWGSDGFVMDGYIDLENCYILNNYVDNAQSGTSNRNTEWTRLQQDQTQLINNLKYGLSQYGLSKQESDFIIEDFTNNLISDNGFAAMLFGADAVLGSSGQLDVLNPTIAKFLRYNNGGN